MAVRRFETPRDIRHRWTGAHPGALIGEGEQSRLWVSPSAGVMARGGAETEPGDVAAELQIHEQAIRHLGEVPEQLRPDVAPHIRHARFQLALGTRLDRDGTAAAKTQIPRTAQSPEPVCTAEMKNTQNSPNGAPASDQQSGQ